MEIVTMGRVTVSAKIANLEDLFNVRRGKLAPEDVRTVEVADALVDTGATLLSMPLSLIQQLGLERFQTRRARTAAGVIEFGVYGTAHLTVQGRECRVDVSELPDDCPVLIGQIALEQLDFVVDLAGRRLIGNPDHGGEQMFDLF